MNFRKGFTLIEILIVVAIIAILAGIVLVGLQPAQQQGGDARRIADLQQVKIALQLYYNTFGSYPNNYDELVQSGLVPGLPTESLNQPFLYEPFDSGSSYVVGVVLGGQKPATAGGLVSDTISLSGTDGSSYNCSDNNIYCVGFGYGSGSSSGGSTSGGTTSGGTTSGGTTSGGTTSGGTTAIDCTDPANAADPACQ